MRYIETFLTRSERSGAESSPSSEEIWQLENIHFMSTEKSPRGRFEKVPIYYSSPFFSEILRQPQTEVVLNQSDGPYLLEWISEDILEYNHVGIDAWRKPPKSISTTPT